MNAAGSLTNSGLTSEGVGDDGAVLHSTQSKWHVEESWTNIQPNDQGHPSSYMISSIIYHTKHGKSTMSGRQLAGSRAANHDPRPHPTFPPANSTTPFRHTHPAALQMATTAHTRWITVPHVAQKRNDARQSHAGIQPCEPPYRISQQSRTLTPLADTGAPRMRAPRGASVRALGKASRWR